MTIHAEIPRTPDPLAWLEEGPRAALFLDLDGTLIDATATTRGDPVPSGLGALLESLHDALDGAVAILTGRPIAEVDRLFASVPLAVAGVHGAEYRTHGAGDVRPAALPLDPSLTEALRAVVDRRPGTRFEDKGAGVAIDWRAVPERETEIETDLLDLLANGPDHLELRRGRRLFEIVPRHVSKGAALEVLAGLDRFAGRRPIMIGDDYCDVSAFAAAEALGGIGFRVAGETFPFESADFASPREVREWLSLLLARARARQRVPEPA